MGCPCPFLFKGGICVKIELQRIDTNYQGDTCLVHARGAKDPNGIMRITMQPLRLSGLDIFYGMQMMESYDSGATWSPIRPCKNLVRQPTGNGMEWVLCDATPMFHHRTGKWLEIGVGVYYLNDERPNNAPMSAVYTVFDEKTEDWLSPCKLSFPAERMETFTRCGNGCGQSYELPNGEILVPINFVLPGDPCTHSTIIRCSFDGHTLRYLEEGDDITISIPRGLYEPSVTGYQNEFFLCLRNDITGYVAKSRDGLHYESPMPLCFDDGSLVGNYNTQQHWIRGGGKLYLVYTRRGLNNDHVFRHRAPLVIGEFDTKRMCILRDTERIIVPERGARLGNFGCTYVNERESYVIASEWMQPVDCEKYGSDNAVFIAQLNF